MDVLQERLEHALTLLEKRDPSERQAGAAELVELAHTGSLAHPLRPRFEALLGDAIPQLRAAACAGLTALGPSPELESQLERASRDPDVSVRREAVRSLAGLEEPSARAALHGALDDADPQVRFEAAVGLAALGDSSGAEVLLQAAQDKYRRFGALAALARLREPRARALGEQLLGKFFLSDFERSQAAGLLVALDVEAGRKRLLARLQKRKADDRGLVMELCGEHRLREAIPLLRAAVGDTRDLFRGTAARSLGLLGDADSEPALIALANDASVDLGIRCDAMEGLMFLRTPGALAALHALSSTSAGDEVRDAANDALAWLQNHPEGRTP